MKEFKYTNRGPLPWAVVRTNIIRMERNEDETITCSRHYVKEDGTYKEDGIKSQFGMHDTAEEIAKSIHWGCCGWSANIGQISDLLEQVRGFYKEQ